MCHSFLQHSNTLAALQPVSAAFQPAAANVTVSLSCVLYLASSLNFVDPSVAEREIRDQVIQGWHELLSYACDHWLDHLRELANCPTRLLPDQYALSRLQRGLESLSHMHTELAVSKGWTHGQKTDTFPSPRDDLWGSLGVSPSVCRLLNQGLMSLDQVSSMPSPHPDQYSTSIARLINKFAIHTDFIRSPIGEKPGYYTFYKRSSPLQEHNRGYLEPRKCY